ncbi:helix-turn-helix transcriptional regulator [Actinomycetospora straminea]|uniref:helix-turn-helix transcriptional regulator n=1 Tax=Actinomycetospora straminea TaxID=663607 RepID=UPI002366FD7F|nr:WYL domain-containing protein [Actinomycetospora straminea]MDD7934665.1 WYL domain-containing protein [Actinomycetospora straminea]
MRDTAARMLALLSLLQSRPDWPGPELAERLGVGVRTVRNDVARLRELGYPVDAATGRAGHYRLGVGASLPPLLLDDDEAVAVALGLRAGTGPAGTREAAGRALTKLERVLPHRLRRTVAALTAATTAGPANTTSDAPDPEVDPALLRTVAEAIRDRTALRVADPEGPARVLEPYRLVSWQRRWYVVVRSPERGTWTVLRADGLELRVPGGPPFTPVEPPEDLTDLVLREVAVRGWTVHARVLVHAPASAVLARINPAVGVVETRDARTCVLVTGADSVATLAAYVGMLDLDFRVEGPPALVAQLRTTGERYLRAVS